MEIGRPTLKDRYNLVYLILLLHGVGNLTPWSVLFNAEDYFTNYKFMSNDTRDGVDVIILPPNLRFCSIVPMVFLTWLNTFAQFTNNDTTQRVIASIGIEVLVFVFIIALVMLDFRKIPLIFNTLTVLSIAAINTANGVYTNVVFGIGAKFSPKYVGAIILGNNISSTFFSLVAIILRLVHTSRQTSAIYCFILGLIVLMLCLDTYLSLPLIKFYRIHKHLTKLHQAETETFKNTNLVKIPLKRILRKTIAQLANVFMVYFVTLSLFPSTPVNIRPCNENFFLQGTFALLICFLCFNLSSMIGSIVAHFIQWPPPKFVIIPVLARLIYIPLYWLCNYLVVGAKRITPIYIILYWVFLLTLAFTSGYFGSVTMQYVPRSVGTQYCEDAGRLAGAILVTATFCGIMCSYVCSCILSDWILELEQDSILTD